MRPASHEERELLLNLVRRYSPSGREEEAATYLVEWLRSRGLRAHLDGAGNACARWGRGAATLCLLGHIDTVSGRLPVGVRGDQLTGRGAVDAKGPLAAMTSALVRVSRTLEEPEDATVLLVGAVDEEGGSRGARYLLRGAAAPAATVIGEPSRWDRLTLGYRGSVGGTLTVRMPRVHTGAGVATTPEEAVRIWTEIVDCAARYNAAEEEEEGTPAPLFRSLSPRLTGLSSGGDAGEGWAEIEFTVRIPPGLSAAQVKTSLQDLVCPHRVRFRGDEDPFIAERNS
ncbi:MAG: M20/M25/M40 family metallo-hydrolase, partial [Bacillota bacterium]